MPPKRKKRSIKAAIITSLFSLFGNRKKSTNPKNLQNADYKTSTQKIGLTFSDRLRNTFRQRWLKKHKL